MRKAVPIMVMMLMAVGCGSPEATAPVSVEDPVVTLPAIPGRPGAAYFTLKSSATTSRLVGIDSGKVGRIELHESMSHGGQMRMAPLADASFSPDAPLRFAPGGRHAMLFDIDPSVQVGDRLRLTFRIDNAPPVTAEAEVRGPGDAGDAAH